MSVGSRRRLRLFPLSTVLFPGAVLNLHVFEPRYKQMISECLADGESFGVVLIREGDEAGDPNIVPHDVGTTAEIDDVTRLEQGRYYISTIGRSRFRIDEVISRDPYLTAEVTYLEDELPDDPSDLGALTESVRAEFDEYLRLLVDFSGVHSEIEVPLDPIAASYAIGDALQVTDSMKQRLLELESVRERLSVELEFLRRLLPQLRALLERKREPPPPAPSDAPDRAYRSSQERFFGKHFSMN